MSRVIQNWVDALRSGNYPQSDIGTLRNWEGYSCLGVLLDIYNPWKWGEYENDYNDGCYRYFADEDDYSHDIPQSIADELNISIKFESRLVYLESEKEYTFDQLADIIEKELL